VKWDSDGQRENLDLRGVEWLVGGHKDENESSQSPDDSLEVARSMQEEVGEPTALVHEIIQVYWPEGVSGWYDAVVLEYDAETGQHRVAYIDGDSESLNLCQHDKPWKRCMADTQQVMDAFELVLKEGDTTAKEYAVKRLDYLRKARSSKGFFSALHLAVSKGHYETVAFLLRQGLDPDSPCGKMQLTARNEAESMKGRGRNRMEIYKLIQLHKKMSIAEQQAAAAGGRTPAPGACGPSMSPIVTDTSVMDSSMDTSLMQPTPNAELQRLVQDGDAGKGRDICSMMHRRHSMKPPEMPGTKLGARQANKENVVNQAAPQPFLAVDTPQEQAPNVRGLAAIQRRSFVGCRTV